MILLATFSALRNQIFHAAFVFIITLMLSGILAYPVHSQKMVTVYIADFPDHDLRKKIEENATATFNEINNAFSGQRKPVFDTEKVREPFVLAVTEMWESAPFYVDETSLILKLSMLSDGSYEMRDVPLTMHDPNGRDHYEEGAVLFCAEGKLIDIRIALPLHRYNTLLREGDDRIDVERRKSMLGFIEKFRTAYNRRDLPFITNVFSDQALIIVGHVVQSTGKSSPFESQVRYLQFTKEEYLQRLGNVFRRNEWIDITFDDIQIVRHPRLLHIYGVSLVQYYSSSTYNDDGYLFLLVDFRAEDNPLIHVRTWQPRYSTPESEIFSIGELEIF